MSASKLNPWTAKPLTDASKSRHFKAVMDLSAERVILGRSAIIAGWTIGVVGAAIGVAGMVCAATLFPLKTTEVRFFLVDQSTGIIGQPVGLQDAPKIFGAAVEQQYLRRYVEAREGWVPELDEYNDHIAKLMSSPDEQARISDDRNQPTSPVKTLAKDGHIQIENLRFFPRTLAKDGVTRSYLVRFNRTVWHGATKDPIQTWTATVDFAWHPSLPMLPDDRTINPGGFQAVAYSAHSDTPETRRQ